MGNKKKSRKAAAPVSELPPPLQTDVDDDGLLDELVAQLGSEDGAVQENAATIIQELDQTNKAEEAESKSSKKDSRARFEARKLRKAADQAQQYTNDDPEADARLEKEAKDEDKAIRRVCDELGLVLHEVNPDGHCLYAAIADQLRLLGIIPPVVAHYGTTRHIASKYIYNHPDDFLPFLPSMEGEDGVGATDAGMMGPREFERYCAAIRDTAVWGGEPEIRALSKAYNVPIHVIQGGTPPIVVHDPAGGHAGDVHDKRAVRISYHRKMYGLGEHYNSLRPKTLSSQLKSLIG